MKPDLSDLPEWGTKVYVLKANGGKLDAKTEEGRWVGYSDVSKGHRVYWPGKRWVTVERDITFDVPILVHPTDAVTEGVTATQGSQSVSGTHHGQSPPPQPLDPSTDPADPLNRFEAADPTADRPPHVQPFHICARDR
jgi:hypothetical protein